MTPNSVKSAFVLLVSTPLLVDMVPDERNDDFFCCVSVQQVTFRVVPSPRVNSTTLKAQGCPQLTSTGPLTTTSFDLRVKCECSLLFVFLFVCYALFLFQSVVYIVKCVLMFIS